MHLLGELPKKIFVANNQVKEIRTHMLLQHADMIATGVPVGLTGLGRHVADIDLQSPGCANRGPDIPDHQIRQDAGIQAARPDQD